jgi:lysozyme
MTCGAKGLALIKESEGYGKRLPDGSCEAYLDTIAGAQYWSPGYRGLWTIGYGCTEGVTKGMVWTEKEATQHLMIEVNKHVAALNAKLKAADVSMDQNEFDATISASYNLGHESPLIHTIIARLKDGDEDGAADAFLSYNRSNGIVREGLVTRRKAERHLFLMHTRETLIPQSRKLSFMQRLRGAISGVGIGSYLTWDQLGQLRQFCTDHAGIMLAVGGISVWLIFKVLENMSVQDAQAGRYVPSGDVKEAA